MWSTVLVGIISVVLVFLLWVLEMKRRFRSISHYPGPKGMPILGNPFDLGLTPVDVMKNTFELVKKYGKYIQLWFGPNRPYLWITDPKFMEFFLSSKHITKSDDYTFLHNWLGTGLLVSSGAKWRKRRKIISPAFHFKILEDFVDVFNNCGEVLIKKLSKHVDKLSVDVYPYITLYALDTICSTAMGVSINAQENSDSQYVSATKSSCNILIERTFSIWKQFDIMYRFSNTYKLQNESLEILHNFTSSVIEQKKKEWEKNLKENQAKGVKEKPDDQSDLGIKKRMAFLDLLLHYNQENDSLTDTDIREEVDTFMFEGHDTTASAISFALYMIARHPDIQEKLIDELKGIFHDDQKRNPTFNDLAEMKYMELVIKETLRLFPSVPFYARSVCDDFTYDGVIYPKGLTITLFVFAMHRDPELFPDPEKFDPERFLVENSREKGNFAYLPFSAGLRNCVGQKFAMLEMKAVISKILKNFRLLEVPGHELVLSAEVVLKSASGILVKLEKRDF